MDSIWVIILSISTPIAGVIGFAIQLRNVKKAHLENEKLSLEIAKLKNAESERKKQIIIPSNEEVIKYALPEENAMLQRRSPSRLSEKSASGLSWNSIGLGIVAIFMLAYLLYDLYRLGVWVLSKL
ncbi:MAG: hypothetical protein K6L76_06795 [Agarilytica sp.]